MERAKNPTRVSIVETDKGFVFDPQNYVVYLNESLFQNNVITADSTEHFIEYLYTHKTGEISKRKIFGNVRIERHYSNS